MVVTIPEPVLRDHEIRFPVSIHIVWLLPAIQNNENSEIEVMTCTTGVFTYTRLIALTCSIFRR